MAATVHGGIKTIMLKTALYALESIPMGVIIYDATLKISFANQKATLMGQRYDLPDKVKNFVKTILLNIRNGRIQQPYEGDLIINCRIDGLPNPWNFFFKIHEGEAPAVYIFFIEQSPSGNLDFDAIRSQYLLTRKECSILRKVIDGLQNKSIANELQITEQTVKDHLSNIYRKMEVSNRNALFRHLLPNGTASVITFST